MSRVRRQPTASPPRAGAPRVRADAAPAEAFHLVVLDHFDGDEDAAPRAATRPRFVRLFASYAGARVSAAMRVRSAPGARQTRFRDIIATHQRIKDYTNRERGSLPDDGALIAFGSDLFETLFQGDVRRLYDEARARQHGRRLDLVFTSMVPWIAEKPWEFAYDRSRQRFLATEDIHFVRNVLTAVPADALVPERGPLRILVVAAQPLGLGQLSIREETAVIRRGFAALVEAGLAEVEVLPRASPASLHQRLQGGGFGVVHFIGHGVFDEASQEGALVFEDAQRRQVMLGQRALREILCQRGIRLVFLNACQSGSGGTGEFNKGVAQALVAHGLPALVANQYSVLDSSATEFARHFYHALAQGSSLGAAAREARIAVNYGLQGEAINWAIPVVYARDPALCLCRPPARRAAPAPSPAASGVARRRTRAVPRYRVAVWDLDGSLPALAATVQKLHAAQSGFGFSLVELSLPVGSWDLQHRAVDGTPYLWAERVAQRLSHAPLDLQVDALLGITGQWLRNDRQLNRPWWWPVHSQPRGQSDILLLSTAGLKGLPARGGALDQAIANLVTAVLAGHLGGLDSHARGRSSCPLARNPSRLVAPLLAPQQFDATCRNKLLSAVGERLTALEALPRAFARSARKPP